MDTTMWRDVGMVVVGCIAAGGIIVAVKSLSSPAAYSNIKFLFFSATVLYFGFELGGNRTLFWVIAVWMAWMLGGVWESMKADKAQQLLTGDVDRLLSALPQLERLAGVEIQSVSPGAADAMTRLPKLNSREFNSYGQTASRSTKTI